MVSPEVRSTTPRPTAWRSGCCCPLLACPALPIKGRAGGWGQGPKASEASEGRQLGSNPNLVTGPPGSCEAWHLLPQQLSRGSARFLRGGHSAVHTSRAAPEADRAAPALAPPTTRPDRANKPVPAREKPAITLDSHFPPSVWLLKQARCFELMMALALPSHQISLPFCRF